jgi:hypothetical protein
MTFINKKHAAAGFALTLEFRAYFMIAGAPRDFP